MNSNKTPNWNLFRAEKYRNSLYTNQTKEEIEIANRKGTLSFKR